jgi:hypothetical protein
MSVAVIFSNVTILMDTGDFRDYNLEHASNTSYTPLMIIASLFLILALLYAWATPPLEASDELWHFGMVNHLAETWTLPVQNPDIITAWEQEGSQPPLYYFLAALLVAPLDRTDFATVTQPNPHVKAGIPGDSDNKNLVLRATSHPPLQGTILAVYVARLFSIVLGCVTVAAVYFAALELSGKRGIAALAGGLTAFNPMFLFIVASVNNDNLVTALNSAIIWQTLVMLRTGFDLRRSVIIALLVALAALSKLSGLVLVPVIAISALWLAWRRGQWRGLVILGVLMASAWLIIAGWWYLRNITLYGELFGTHMMVAVAGARLEPFTLQTALSEFEGFRVAYWGLFGAVNVLTFAPFYLIMDVLTVVALVGLAWAALRGSLQRPGLIVLSAIIIIGFAAFLQWTAQTYASQGRLLFPFVAAISPLMAVGLAQWMRILPATPAASLPGGVVVSLGAFALIVPFASIAPQYAPPPPLTAPPAAMQPVYAQFGAVTLIGYEIPDRRYQPGEQVPITVYWQVNEQTERDLSLYLHAVDPAGKVIGRIDSFPGAGRLRTKTWQPGAVYADAYRIPLEHDSDGRYSLRVQVGWWHYASGEVIQPLSEAGEALESVMLNAGAFGAPAHVTLPDAFTPTERVDFGGLIALIGYRLEGDYLELAWESIGALPEDYTVFVQVLDDTSTIVAQGDAPPALPTRYWQAGEIFITKHGLIYSETGSLINVLVGWYHPTTFARLRTNHPQDAYELIRLNRN